MTMEQVVLKNNNDVLIVDDNAANLKFLTDILIADGYSVMACTNGGQALLSVRVKLPSIILLDVMMPEMDGFEVCR